MRKVYALKCSPEPEGSEPASSVPSFLFSCYQGEVANLGVRWATERHFRLGVVSGVPLFLLPRHLQEITTSADFKKKCQTL